MDERSSTLTCLMTMNRLFSPTSENAMPDWMLRTALGDILGVDVEQLSRDSLCRSLDRLHPHRQAIEAHLARPERERSLAEFQQIDSSRCLRRSFDPRKDTAFCAGHE
jgi:hypothetical protein